MKERLVRVEFRCYTEEKQAMEQAAEDAGQSLSQFVRDSALSALGGRRRSHLTAQIKAVTAEEPGEALRLLWELMRGPVYQLGYDMDMQVSAFRSMLIECADAMDEARRKLNSEWHDP